MIPWPHYEKRFGVYVLPFLGVDGSIVKTSQRWLAKHRNEPPVQFIVYSGYTSIWQTLFTLIGLMVLLVLSQFAWTRNLLLKYPDELTGGIFKREGPSAQQIKETQFITTMIARAFSKRQDVDVPGKVPDVVKTFIVHGPEMAYVTTPMTVVNAALVLCSDQRIPRGALTSAAAFGQTDLVERMHRDGMTIREVEFK